mgnify:CR=1 FL=1
MTKNLTIRRGSLITSNSITISGTTSIISPISDIRKKQNILEWRVILLNSWIMERSIGSLFIGIYRLTRKEQLTLNRADSIQDADDDDDEAHDNSNARIALELEKDLNSLKEEVNNNNFCLILT